MNVTLCYTFLDVAYILDDYC